MEINVWEQVIKKLQNENKTISAMESCTGGGLANEITNISGASEVLKESYVTYCNEAKIKHGVPKEIIEKHTVYSIETAVAMAKAMQNKTGADFSIGITGMLGRIDPLNPVDNINCVWYAISDRNKNVIAREIKVKDVNRKEQKEIVINEVAKTLLEIQDA